MILGQGDTLIMARSRQVLKHDKRTVQRTDNQCLLELVQDERLLVERCATLGIRCQEVQEVSEFEGLERSRRLDR